jgi:hypothetical protein
MKNVLRIVEIGGRGTLKEGSDISYFLSHTEEKLLSCM